MILILRIMIYQKVGLKLRNREYGCGVKILECIYSLNVKERFGNILRSYSKLCSEICRAFHNCTISEKFENVCDCEYEIIEKEINSGLTTESNCGCET